MNAKEIIKRAVETGLDHLPEYEGYQVFSEYDVPVPAAVFVDDETSAEEKCRDFLFPAVLKIVSPDIIHKSDVGGVAVGIEGIAELKNAMTQMRSIVTQKAENARIDGFLVTSMADKGVEVIIGGMNHAVFGPTVMFGMGGVYVELFRDAAFRLAPLSEEEARRQMESTKVWKLLQGLRGAKPCDVAALAKTLCNVGRILTDFPEIKEIDLNPVISYPESCCAVDARIIL